MLEGQYVVGLNGSSQPVVVRAEQRTSLRAGTLALSAPTSDELLVYDAAGAKYLGRLPASQALELLPGKYVVTSKVRGHRTVFFNEVVVARGK